MIIGLSGKKQSGKNTAAKIIKDILRKRELRKLPEFIRFHSTSEKE